jgi:uncharacterized protein YdiU (UPF0061 family)
MSDPFHFENSYQRLPEVYYAQVAPVPVASPELVVFNDDLAGELGLDCSGLDTQARAALFSGNDLPEAAQPIAQAYAGHQFGGFTMLGDGRAHLIGEQITPSGKRFDIQFKGSGQTPFSRRGDGRAVLGPMLREYLVSEAMAALGIPTTRALAVVTTGEAVQRETPLPGAILTRIAASHIRVGTFQYAAIQEDRSLLGPLLDYTIDRHHPELADADNKAIALLDATIERQADLIVHWMRVGFIHGVMNTDNMALSGETIDYGPCAFMDTYDPATVFSSIDHNGRYAYANQPGIALWNLTRLAEALLAAIDADEEAAVKKAEASLNRFSDVYRDKWLAMMRAKLGLFGNEDTDTQLITDLLNWMKESKADFTNTFLELTNKLSRLGFSPATGLATCRAEAQPTDSDAFAAWHTRWRARLEENDQPIEAAQQLMQRTNPAVIPRNHKVEAALTAATEGDMQPFHKLHAVLQRPYEDSESLTPYQAPPGPEACRYQTFCGT